MSRRNSRSTSSRRSSKGKSGNNTAVYILIAVCVLGLLGAAAWFFLSGNDYKFKRADLDKYVAATQNVNLLGDGASVYVDMSDGMNSAYASAESKAILQSVVNKLAANELIEFYGLADDKITPINLPHTQLYNYILSPASYDKQRAPIEQTLATIVAKNQPAMLMTDFEEFNGGIIQQAAYAKQYFIEWLAKGFNITFYKWDFTEDGKAKHMFLAVFDDNANRLNSMVDNAIKTTVPDIATFVLGSRDFAYPTVSNYATLKDGGNYHNSQGQDAVTAVMSGGGAEDYFSYSVPYAQAEGAVGKFAPLNTLVGSFSEYYPLGVSWANAINNASKMQENGVPQEDLYTHFLRNLYINFNAQNGYEIEGIEARVFDMQQTMYTISQQGDSVTVEELEAVDKPEVNLVFTASMESSPKIPQGWNEIFVDFDANFTGTFMGGRPSTNLLRANIVISKASPRIAEAMDFFGWEGNPSLANSVKETLTAATTSPNGRILYTYYIRTLAE